MKNHLGSDSVCNIVNLQCPIIFLPGMTNNARFTFSVGDTHTHGWQLVLSKTNIIGDTKYKYLV